ncbi:hypothetical protein EU803_15335 [Loktanella sp. IMCC34160]|uniref:anti-sigma factor n=1 Tax=Loktanella sp. IMCC34160 TaxID=2510646 RepID=UPI00101DCFD1|nr:anti-sigma factor [Loktanella sp. IMCC34160]RYG89988.1 hypothetical protein EU803_15335 [Loktanella sp. IMCC34160]
MSMPDETHEEDGLAAEYVLRLLDETEHQEFEARIAEDRHLRARVHEWESRLVPLAEDVQDVAPPASVKIRLMGTIMGTTTARRAIPIWTWLAGGAVAAAVFMFVLFGNSFRPSIDMSPAFQAELASGDGSVVLIASVIPTTHEIVIERLEGAPPLGLVHELWLIAEGAEAPVSLGLLQPEGATRIRVPDEIADGVRTGTIAISEEPPGGSTTGAPTGRVVAAAQFSDV